MRQRAKQIWNDAIAECSSPRAGICAVCDADTLNLPIHENGMLRQAVLCPNCTYGGNPPVECIAAIQKLRAAKPR